MLFYLSSLFRLSLYFSIIFLILYVLFAFYCIAVYVIYSFVLFRYFSRVLLLVVAGRGIGTVVRLGLFFLHLSVASYDSGGYVQVRFSHPIRRLSQLTIHSVYGDAYVSCVGIYPFLREGSLVPYFFGRFLRNFHLVNVCFTSRVIRYYFLRLFLPLFSFCLIGFLAFRPTSHEVCLNLRTGFVMWFGRKFRVGAMRVSLGSVSGIGSFIGAVAGCSGSFSLMSKECIVSTGSVVNVFDLSLSGPVSLGVRTSDGISSVLTTLSTCVVGWFCLGAVRTSFVFMTYPRVF